MTQYEPKSPQDDQKWPQEHPKTSPRGIQEVQKSEPGIARRKKDRTKTIPRSSWTHQGLNFPVSVCSRGSIWEPKTAPKSTPKRPKKRSRRIRRKKDRTKTIPRPSWTAPGPISLAQRRPREVIWKAKTAPKSIPKRSKIDVKIQESKKPIQDDLGPVLGRS